MASITGVNGQAFNLFRAEGGPAKRLRQQARGAGKSKRQEDRYITGLERGLADPHLAGEGQARVLIGRLFVAVDRQQFSAAAIRG